MDRRAGVGEVAAPAAADTDLLARRLGVVDHQDGTPTLARLDGAHHAGRARADHHNVEGFQGFSVLCSPSFDRSRLPESTDWRARAA